MGGKSFNRHELSNDLTPCQEFNCIVKLRNCITYSYLLCLGNINPLIRSFPGFCLHICWRLFFLTVPDYKRYKPHQVPVQGGIHRLHTFSSLFVLDIYYSTTCIYSSPKANIHCKGSGGIHIALRSLAVSSPFILQFTSRNFSFARN